MGGRGQHVVQRRQPLCHKEGDLLEGLALDDQLQVVAAAHQQHALHLVEGGDGSGNFVKAAALLGADVQLDDGFHPVHAGLLPVHEGLVALDDPLRPGQVYHSRHLGGGFIQHGRDVLHRHPGIVFKDLQKLFHRCLSFVQPVAIFIDKYSTLPGSLHLVFASSAGDRHSFSLFPCSFFQKECSFFVKSAILEVSKPLPRGEPFVLSTFI